MTDTVKRLIALADDYALRNYHHDDPDSREAARQALHDELVRLFTPLSDEQIRVALGLENLPWLSLVKDIRAVEKAHGIGGES